MKKKTIVTVLGIRPDAIRLSEVIRKLDEEKSFKHILIHSGQHYSKQLSGIFFEELEIREPDYNLQVGGEGKEHFHITADLSVKIIELFRKENIKPDLILFLGDSNSVCCAVQLKKEGYKIGHIEAGMRSGDINMLEEINRITCDHVSDFLFVYHNDYKKNLLKEGIPSNKIHIIGNTIVEVVNKWKQDFIEAEKFNNQIILDIHRPENFKFKNRLQKIIKYAKEASEYCNAPVYMLGFPRTLSYIKKYNISLKGIVIVDLLGYKEYIKNVYHSAFIISDSGTAQEEPALLGTKVIVPRDFTERFQSCTNGCSMMLFLNDETEAKDNFINSTIDCFITNDKRKIKTKWLGNGKTSETIVKILKEQL